MISLLRYSFKLIAKKCLFKFTYTQYDETTECSYFNLHLFNILINIILLNTTY